MVDLLPPTSNNAMLDPDPRANGRHLELARINWEKLYNAMVDLNLDPVSILAPDKSLIPRLVQLTDAHTGQHGQDGLFAQFPASLDPEQDRDVASWKQQHSHVQALDLNLRNVMPEQEIGLYGEAGLHALLHVTEDSEAEHDPTDANRKRARPKHATHTLVPILCGQCGHHAPAAAEVCRLEADNRHAHNNKKWKRECATLTQGHIITGNCGVHVLQHAGVETVPEHEHTHVAFQLKW